MVIYARAFAVLLCLCAAAGLVALLHYYDPSVHRIFPPCLVRTLTGIQCPGCGTARALHALTEGDLRSAIMFNPLAIMLIPAVVYTAAGSSINWIIGKRMVPHIRTNMLINYTVVGVILIFTILKNIAS